MKPRPRRVELVLNVIILAVALGAAAIGGRIYTEQVQIKGCYEYAQRKALPELADLDFAGVVIASNLFRGHICQFTNRRTGLPVSLEFDAADVPYVADILDAFSMIVPFLAVGVLGAIVTHRLRRQTKISPE